MTTIPAIKEAFSPELVVKWWRQIALTPGRYYVESGPDVIEHFRHACRSDWRTDQCRQSFSGFTKFSINACPWRSDGNFNIVTPSFRTLTSRGVAWMYNYDHMTAPNELVSLYSLREHVWCIQHLIWLDRSQLDIHR